MKYSTVLVVLCCIAFVAMTMAAPNLAIEPVGDVYAGGTSKFKFVVSNWDTDFLPGFKMTVESPSKLAFVPPSAVNYHTKPIDESKTPCTLENDAGFTAGLIETKDGEVSFTPSELKTTARTATIVCLLSISNLEDPGATNLAISYTSGGTQSIPLSLSKSFVKPKISIQSAVIQPITRVNNQKVSNYSHQELVYKFTTNVVDNLFVRLADANPALGPITTNFLIQDMYCTTGSGKNLKTVARQYSPTVPAFYIFFKEKTSDEVTCRIPLLQASKTRLPPFAYLTISYGEDKVRATTGIENINVPNLGNVKNMSTADCFSNSASCGLLDFELTLGNRPSYISQNSTVEFTFDNLDISYLRLNETFRSRNMDLRGGFTRCTSDGNDLIHVTASRRKNSVYFTDFLFDQPTAVTSLKCVFQFDNVFLRSIAQGYGTVKIEVNGNTVYSPAGSPHLRILFPTNLLMIKGKQESYTPEAGKLATKFDFRVRQHQIGTFLLRKPILQIAIPNLFPVGENALKCTVALPTSSEYTTPNFITHTNGLHLEIPLDAKTKVLDHHFVCDLVYDPKYVAAFGGVLAINAYDMIENNHFIASGSLEFTIPASAEIPEVKTMPVSCIQLTLNGIHDTHQDVSAFATDYMTAYNKIAKPSKPATFGIYRNVEVKRNELMDPFAIEKPYYSLLTTNSTRVITCVPKPETAPADFSYSQIYFELKAKHSDLRSIQTAAEYDTIVIEDYTNDKCGYQLTSASSPCAREATCQVHADCITSLGLYCVNKKCVHPPNPLVIPETATKYYYDPMHVAQYSGSMGTTTIAAMGVTMMTIFAMVFFF